ncbi:hypothetical protein LRS06_12755 [Hymenobacter sp. J193]|uniref:hypothetical protein n=1 Tax=Hymenobacter sp. J193 TaxID=2898429 RepID=UPI0021508F2E|nr:hypothetical protein [Hymenobacter sp. J193]MCR5888618.1 hypothetical protein [Hymenobacter sp. J193]
MSPPNFDWPLCLVPHARQHNASQLARVAPDGQLHRLRPRLPFPFTSFQDRNPQALSEAWVVGVLPYSLRDARQVLFRARLHAHGQRLERLPDVVLPSGLGVKTLLLDGDWLYLGGGISYWGRQHLNSQTEPVGEYFSRLHLADDPAPLTPIPLPVAFGPGKEIDDLQRDAEGRLLVLDNVVMPKYLFLYQLQGQGLPQWLQTHPLVPAGTYETYERASWNEELVVLLSRTVGEGGTGQHLSVLRRPDFKLLSRASTYLKRDRITGHLPSPLVALRDAVVCGQYVVFVVEGRGLGYFRVSPDTPWPKRRVTHHEMLWMPGRKEIEERRRRVREWVPPLELATAGSEEGITWLPPAPGQPARIETIRLVHPGVLLLTGRNHPREPAFCWTQTFPPHTTPL